MNSSSHPSYASPWAPRLTTLLLAALAAASVGYWVLHWSRPSSPILMNTPEPAARPIDTAKVAQLLGASRAALGGNATAMVSPSSNFKLLGVIAAGPHDGSALISAFGKAAKPFRVGDHVSDDLVLQSVLPRSVTLSPSLKEPASMTLDLPVSAGTRGTP